MLSPLVLYRCKTAHTFHLADGQSWDLHYMDGLEHWGDSFASMMNLVQTEESNGTKLIFVDMAQEDRFTRPTVRTSPLVIPDFEKQSWSPHDPGPVRIWSSNVASEKVIELLFLQTPELQTISMLFCLIPMYHTVINNGGLPFHAALLTRNGSGVLIAARGDGGKSTCATRIPKPWQALCDDEAIIVRDRSGRFVVHPFPTWSDHVSGRSHKTWDVQRYVPLRAIFFLEQAGEDRVVEISKAEAAIRAHRAAEQVSTHTWRGLDAADVRKFRQKLFENACELVKTVPTYILQASLTGRFWEEIEKALI
jgi:SynChlorMet cassette protein ScmC